MRTGKTTVKPGLPPLNSLKAFLAVMRHGNLRGAAKELAVTPQAVGHQMKVLEKMLQVSLFERKANEIKPTEKAVLFFHFVKAGFGAFEEGLAAIPSPR